MSEIRAKEEVPCGTFFDVGRYSVLVQKYGIMLLYFRISSEKQNLPNERQLTLNQADWRTYQVIFAVP